jgi:hypothetical protein
VNSLSTSTYAPNGSAPSQELVTCLLSAPDEIAAAKKTLDAARVSYERWAIRLSLVALSQKLFEGKDGPRPAGNDKERDLALDYVFNRSDALRERRAVMEAAQRDYDLWKHRNENYQLIARLIIGRE